MELRLDVILYYKLGKENYDAAISNAHAGRRFPTPGLNLTLAGHFLVDSDAVSVAFSVSNPGFPEAETRCFGYFLLPETRFFQLPNLGFLKILELLWHSNFSNSDNTEVADWRV